MSKRRTPENTTFEAFVDLVLDIGKTIPWWASIPIALGLFLFVPLISPASENAISNPSSVAVALLLYLFLLVFKYLVPTVLLLGLGIGLLSKATARKCPKCGNLLIARKGRHGQFLGCKGYPACTYTESV